jgi:hypothetical protein
MDQALTLAFAAAVPFLCLGLLMWLARLEDTLTDGLEATPAAAPDAAHVPAAAAPVAEPVRAATVLSTAGAATDDLAPAVAAAA